MYRNIEAERARYGLSRQQLAKELGVTAATLRSWIRGAAIPSKKLEMMAEYFKCSTDYLLEQKPA